MTDELKITSGAPSKFAAGGSVTIMPSEEKGGSEAQATMLPDGMLEFGPKYTPELVAEAFWEYVRNLVFGVGRHFSEPVRIQAGLNSDGTGGASVLLFKTGKVMYERFIPDSRAKELWETMAKSRPSDL